MSGAVALLVNILSSGGAQRRIATLANRFAELGREVDVVSTDADGPMRGMLAPGIRVVTLGGSSSRQREELTGYLGRAAPSALMSCVTDTHRLAVDAAGADGRHVPVILRASRDPYRSLAGRSLLSRALEPIKLRRARRTYAEADAIVTLSANGRQSFGRLLGDRPIRIETILNPVVRSTLLDRPADQRVRRRNAVPLILGIGRLVKQKDFATLLKAFALLRAERPARLALLGEGPERPALEAQARKLGIASDVEMPGDVDTVAGWLHRADLLVSSSLWEGLQAAPIEALAVGCPVVATDCPGGARETLRGGRLGPLVPVQDPAAMARAMRRQLDHPPDPALLAAGALPYSAAGKAERYLALFDDLATGATRVC